MTIILSIVGVLFTFLVGFIIGVGSNLKYMNFKITNGQIMEVDGGFYIAVPLHFTRKGDDDEEG